MVGYFGCVNDQVYFVKNQGDFVVNIVGVVMGDGSVLDFLVLIQGYEVFSSVLDSNFMLGVIWVELIDLLMLLKSLVLCGGSDVFVFCYFVLVGVLVISISVGSDNIIGFDGDLGRWLIEEGVVVFIFFGIVDCSYVDVFVGIYVVGSVIVSGVMFSCYNVQLIGEIMFYCVELIVYYVGMLVSGELVLMCVCVNVVGNYDVCEEFVEGIENLQVMYGLDIMLVISQIQLLVGNVIVQGMVADVSMGNDVVVVNQWCCVGQVQVGVLVCSLNFLMVLLFVVVVNDLCLLGVCFVLVVVFDGCYCVVYELIIVLCNCFFGN